jgi:hypothetical protein
MSIARAFYQITIIKNIHLSQREDDRCADEDFLIFPI